MKILHLLRSEPDEMVKMLIDAIFKGSDSIRVNLYEESEPDYEWLVQQLFAADKVVSWW